jgi:hypothetical protein
MSKKNKTKFSVPDFLRDMKNADKILNSPMGEKLTKEAEKQLKGEDKLIAKNATRFAVAGILSSLGIISIDVSDDKIDFNKENK